MTSIEWIIDWLSKPLLSPEQAAPLGDDVWENIVVTAIALGLAPLLYRRLVQAEISLPPMALAKLAVTHKAHARRNQEIGQQLAEVLAACAAQQLRVIVLKGALLAPAAYAEPALRPMNDIDLLFQPDDLGRAAAVLESLGYSGKHRSSDQGPGVTKHLSTYRRTGNEGQTPNPYLSAGGDRMVEPHGSLEESWFGLKVDITPGVWERAIPICLHDKPAYRLSAADMLLHLTVHATFHVIMGSSVFVQLYDIGLAIQTWGGELNWSEVISLARKAEAEPFLYAGLFWAKRLFQAPIPDEPLLALAQGCRPDILAYIRTLDAPALLRRTQHPPLVTVGQRLRRGLLDRKETARWANSWAGKWQVWQTALAFHKTDTVSLLKRRVKAAP